MAEDSPQPFKQSLETQAIIERLKTARMDELITYREIEALVGQPVDASFGPLRTAIHRMEVDEDKLFKPDRSHGIVWLNDVEIVNDAADRTRSIRRHATRTIQRAQKVANYSGLSPENQRRHSALVSTNAVLAYMTKPKQIKELENAIPPGHRELPINETLAMFTSKKEG